jgi:hypothetical protein
MIAITLMIRPHDSSLWLELVRHRFRRFESVALENDELLVWVPSVGSLLLTESAGSLGLQAVVRSSEAASMLRARITSEVSAAVPGSLCGDHLSLEWSAHRVGPGSVPVTVSPAPLRATRGDDAVG